MRLLRVMTKGGEAELSRVEEWRIEYVIASLLFFFFSSRRRHTRLQDWSSDVCSSDLSTTRGNCSSGGSSSMPTRRACSIPAAPSRAAVACWRWWSPSVCRSGARANRGWLQIGRAACRGRGEISGGAGLFKKKKKNEIHLECMKDKIIVLFIVKTENFVSGVDSVQTRLTMDQCLLLESGLLSLVSETHTY